MEVDHVGFRELTKPAVLKITPSGMLHLFYPPRKPETPPSPRTVSEVLLVSCCHDGCGKFPPRLARAIRNSEFQPQPELDLPGQSRTKL
jgi:hypothetical protein